MGGGVGVGKMERVCTMKAASVVLGVKGIIRQTMEMEKGKIHAEKKTKRMIKLNREREEKDTNLQKTANIKHADENE